MEQISETAPPTDETNLADHPNIHHITFEDKEILLIGTAHVSQQSAQLVMDTIEKETPDTVCVELCSNRLLSITQTDRWKNMDIIKIIREKKTLMLFMNLVLTAFQKKIADKFQIKPGQEMINAVNAAEKTNARLLPVDREIQITLTRVWRSMGLWTKIKLLFSLIFSFGEADSITEEDIEQMKQEDILSTLLADVKEKYPQIQRSLIDERDQCLAHGIRTAPGEKIVAVLGAAHIPGVTSYIKDHTPIDIKALQEVPPPGVSGKIIKWLIPALILMVFAAGFMMEGKSVGADMIWIWIAANGLFAGIGAILALAHPWTIIAAILAAPLTSLNPMIAAGWVSGLVEAFSRKPKVRDLEAIPNDITSVRGFWRNNLTRILLVVIFTNLGSSIGTITALPLMLKLFS